MLEYGVDALEMHADALADGARVLVHDDLLATGGTARALCELVEQLGGEVVGCAFLVELAFLDGPRAAGGLRRPRARRLRRRVRRADRARQRTVAAPPERVWRVVGDPHHLPRWWPRVAARGGRQRATRCTEVLRDRQAARVVRADFRVDRVAARPSGARWAQELDGHAVRALLRERARPRSRSRPAGDGDAR